MENIVFVYSARETPWPGMGRYFLEHKGVVADIVERGETIIRKRLGVSLRALLASDQPFPEAMLTPINAVTQIALSAQWQERGVDPSAIVCRCSGEFASAYVSGSVAFEDALELPCRMARLIDSGKGRGKLIVVRLTCADARALTAECPVRCETVAEAGEDSTVVGCRTEDATAVRDFFTSRGITSALTPLIIASHTWLVEEAKEDLLRPLSKPSRPARLPIYSATAEGLLPPVRDWSRHFWRVVRDGLSIRMAIAAALDDGFTRFIEIGGQPTLRPFFESAGAARGLRISSLATMERNRSFRATMDETLAGLREPVVAV